MSENDTTDSVSMPDVLVTARSLKEYIAMFDLDTASLSGKCVLDCPGGAASFTAEMRAHGADSFSIDPIYGGDRDLLRDKVQEEVEKAAEFARINGSRFDWKLPGGNADNFRARVESAGRFLSDFEAHPSHYVAALLPDLPFSDDAFDVALSSHLLFTYSSLFDADFHVKSALELARVACEVRAYPLVAIDGEEKQELLNLVVGELESAGHRVETRASSYGFQPQATEFLHITRA